MLLRRSWLGATMAVVMVAALTALTGSVSLLRSSRRARRGVGAVAALLLLAGLVVVTVGSSAPRPPAPVVVAPEELSASRAARVQGSRVEVASLTSETSTTYANPDGSWTLEQSVGPVRVRKGGGWVPVDPSLVKTGRGTFAPKATTVGVEFSSGGRQPLARSSSAGKEMSLLWPRELPAPSVKGDTATYADVLPGVDLRVRSTDVGFGHDIVVKTREAAANPAVKRIKFGLVTRGVRVISDEAGNLSAEDDRGAVVFHASAPMMWDSPDDGGRRVERRVGVQLDAKSLTLLPDEELLRDPDARFPLVIDPTYSYFSPGSANSWSFVRRAFPDVEYWNHRPSDDDERTFGVARIGHAPGWPSSFLDRSLFKFDTARLAGTTVVSATFKIYQVWKYLHSCDASQVDPMVLYKTGGIGPNTNWNNQPAVGATQSTARTTPKLSYCPTSWVGMNAKDAVQDAANAGAGSAVLGLKASDEAGDSGWKRFYAQNGNYPWLSVTYNHRPTIGGLGTEPSITPCRWCAGVRYVGATTLNLTGTVSDADGGQVTGQWTINPGAVARSQTLAAGSKFATPLDTRALANGTSVTWSMRGNDGALVSSYVNGPGFVVDKTAPLRVPKVSGLLYKEDNRWHGGVGVPDTFTFQADPVPDTDPNQSGNQPEVNDVDHYLWGWQDPPAAKVDASGALGGGATVSISPVGDGPRTLYVQSVDRAGNRSATKEYRFYVRAGNGALAQWSLDDNTRDTAFLGDRHGTLEGTAAYVPGAVGRALDFDGGSVTAPSAVATDTSFTVSAWVRLTGTSGPQTAVSQSGISQSEFQLGYRPDGGGGKWAFWLPQADSTTAGTDVALSGSAAPVGAWTHLTGVYDGPSDELRLYVNGDFSAKVAHTSAWKSAGAVRVGNGLVSGSLQNNWLGAVDEVKLYDRVLTATEIKAAVVSSDVVVARWKLDEAADTGDESATTARNAVEGGDMAVLLNGARFSREGVADGGGVELDGIDDVVTTNTPTVRTDQSFSVSAWVRLDSDIGARTVLSQDGDYICSFCLQYESGSHKWVFVMPTNDALVPSGYSFVRSKEVAQRGVPTHLVGVYDAAAGRVKLYVDGELAGEQVRAVNWPATGAFQIGRAKVSGNPTSFFDGGVDDVRIYSRAITAEEVRGLVSVSNVTVGWWKLDGDSNDESSLGHHGTVNGAVDWTAGQSPNRDPSDLAARMFGDGGHVSAPHAVDTNRTFSVSAWARLDEAGKAMTVVSEDGSKASGFKLGATASGRWSFGMYRSDVIGAVLDEAVGTASVQVGQWTHLVGIYRPDLQLIELYVNGVLVGSASHATVFNAFGLMAVGRGKKDGANVDYVTGAVDDVAVYSRALPAEEIRTMAGRDLSLVHEWQLDETSGGTAADSVGSRGGTLTGGANFGTGRVGNAIRLDGVDDAVRTDGLDLRTDQSFTVSAWVLLQSLDSSAVAVSVDGAKTSKFRLGYLEPDEENPLGLWAFEMPEADTDTAVVRAALSAWESEVNTWTHLVGVYNSSTKMLSLYVNGVRQNDSSLTSAWTSSGGLQIGRGKASGAPADYWPGGVDEVRMYVGALDNGRISALYKSFPVEAPPPDLPEADRGLWTFNENSGTTAADTSGRGMDATLTAGAGWVGGRKGSAAWLNGISDYAQTAGKVLDTDQSFSVAAWVYQTSTGGPDKTVVGQDGNQASAFQLQYNAATGRWAVLVPKADQANPATTVITAMEAAWVSDWTHLAVVYDAPARRLKLYVNGVLAVSKLGVTVLPSSGRFSIGRGKWNGANSAFFPRGIDDVRAFGRALTDGEVRLVHDDVKSVGMDWFRFDDGTARDYQWRGNDATRTATGTSFVSGISGKALQLDGQSGAAATRWYGPAMRDSFTVSGWAKLTRGDRVATVLGQDGARMSGFVLQYRPEIGRWVFGARTQDSDGAALTYASSDNLAVLNQWVHLTGVYDRAGQQLRLYVNGALSGVRDKGALWPATGGFTIGRGKVNGQSAEFFQGTIDEVRVDQGMVSEENIAAWAGWPTPQPGTLGSFVNAAGDHYTAPTGTPPLPGYHFETTLGVAALPDEPGTRTLYSCRTGTDMFTSTDPACGGQVPLGEVGQVYVAPPTDTAAMPIYACTTAQDRFDSRQQAGCTGATVLGYTAAYAPLARYRNLYGTDHWATTDAPYPSYVTDGSMGWVSLVAQTGTQPLMSCRDGVDEFTSTDPACEDKQVLATIGHLYVNPPVDLESAPLYRCLAGTQRFTSANECAGGTVDRLLGHVLLAPPVQVEAA